MESGKRHGDGTSFDRFPSRTQRDDSALIQGLGGQALSEQARLIVDEFWEMRRPERTRALFWACVEPDPSTCNADPTWLPAFRALPEMETRLTTLPRRQLQRLGAEPATD